MQPGFASITWHFAAVCQVGHKSQHWQRWNFLGKTSPQLCPGFKEPKLFNFYQNLMKKSKKIPTRPTWMQMTNVFAYLC